MARKRTGMKKIREVIRLKSTTELSDRQIARALNVSRPVVAKYWEDFQGTELSFKQIKEMADSELIRLIEKPRIQKSSKYLQLAQYFPYFVIQLLWREFLSWGGLLPGLSCTSRSPRLYRPCAVFTEKLNDSKTYNPLQGIKNKVS